MATIRIKRGTTDPTAANVTNSGELAANTSTPKIWLKTADDGTTTPIWVGAQIETSPGDWTSAVKLATQSAINTTFMPKAGGTFTGVVNFGQGATAPGEIRLLEDTDDGSNYSAFRGSARTTNITYLMPTTDPTAGQVLSAAVPSSNISQLSWADASSATTVTTTSDNTNTTRYLVMSTTAGSGSTLYVDDTTTPLSYNPSTGVITAVGLTLSGDLTVNGTTTNINTTNLVVEDKNVIIGDVATPSDLTADGGGITLKGATDKTFNWVDATDAWTSSEHLNLASGKAYYINGTSVLSSNTLGSGVTASSLTSVGTIGTGTWEATDVGLSHGGTNASLTAVNGGVVYSTASAMAISAAGTSGQVLTSAGAAAPTWTSQSSLSVGSATTATTATTATNVGLTEATSSDNTALYLTFAASGASGALKIDATAQAGLSVLSYVPSTGVLTAYKVEAIVDGGTF
jgi:hypothetical protein